MAANKTHAMTQLCDLTQCCICLKTFTDPRMLPCIHTFCFQCLKDWAVKSEKKPGDEIQCPVCRKQFTIPSEGVQGVQKNFFMASFIEVRNALTQSKKTLPCDICRENNVVSDAQISKATMRCLVCQKNLCEGCCKMHKSFKMSRNHKILKIRSEVGETDAIKSLQVTNCDIHRGKSLHYYCANCEKIVCVSCFVESHKTHDCKNVNTVEEEVRQSIKSRVETISTLARELLAKKKLESKGEFLKKIAARESEILQRSKELKDIIDEHTKSLLSSLAEMKNRHLKEIQVEEEELDRRLTLLESFSRYCDELRTKESAIEVCRNKDELLRKADELEEDHEEFIMRPRISFDVTFQETEFENNWPKTTKINIIGMLKENVEQLEDFGVFIHTNHKIYKINLRRPNEKVVRIQDIATTVKEFPSVAVFNNTMFITGVGETLNEVWKYNFDFGWKMCGSLVQGRECHCAEFIGETLYICGGYWKHEIVDSIEAYNALRETNATVGQLKAGVALAACVTYKDSIYIFGGLGRYGKPLDCVQLYNPVDKTCTVLSTPLPRPGDSFRSVSWVNYAIVLNYDTCFIFDLNKNIWHERQQFKTDAICFGMVAENGRIFVIGGRRRADVRSVRASSIVNNEAANWKTHTLLPKPSKVVASANLTLQKGSTWPIPAFLQNTNLYFKPHN